jgi:CRISPR-associated protein Cas1
MESVFFTAGTINWSKAKTTPLDAVPARPPAEAHSRFLYLLEQGTYLRKMGTRLQVTREKQVLLEVPGVKLQGVLVYGNIQVSTQCLRHLMDEGVWLAFFSRHGTYRGRIQSPAERGGLLRLRQWRRLHEPDFCLSFARSLVRGKVLGACSVASLIAKSNLSITLSESSQHLRDSLDRVEAAKDLDELRGIEGNAARAWFEMFRRANLSDLPFETREKRGAQTPVNALLNLGYTLLTRELDGLLEAAGLDPIAGFYHQPEGDRPALACDLVEEFRHEIVDRLILRLINKRMIQAGDFDNREEKGGLRLTSDGLRNFVSAYEQMMIGKTPQGDTESSGTAPGFRKVFLQQLGRLLDSLLSGEPYVPHNQE